MDTIRATLTRDSVAAGDDCDAPHERAMSFESGTTVEQAVTAIAASNYLASISGGLATWVASVDERTVAVIAQQWDRPRMLDRFEGRAVPLRTGAKLHFAYRCQEDPFTVLAWENRFR